ncbi:tRNA 2-selenouridine synthase, partial [Campylobacter coli]|nr:tRNA 2-selenouridine synthase [Campylobacter coli]EAI8095647.1 tRNA 2-selenouridine synthase [Campylobacter coli]EAI9374934.1 tRNA 2-selenouridine synthase [Campylobacter coli]EAJ6316066.1 tRNA 2-selenouridine synthase [Campylobacter coli]EAK2894716.1 tRNA 2-selenouridine synthase [Campylobacter coli]
MGSEIKVGNETHFVNFSYLKKKFPQILSNGCKYYR